MDFAVTDEQAAMAELAKQILTDGATPERMRPLEKNDAVRFDRDLWREIAESGLLGVAIPEEYGGADLGFFELALVIEQVGRTTAPIPYLETTVHGALPIARFGSDEQKTEWLPRAVAGDVILTSGLHEAEADIEKPLTTATRAGDEWILNGTKICVPYGQVANGILIPASTPDGQIAIFIADPSSAEVSVEPLITTSRQPEATLELNELRVSEAARLGDLASGAQMLNFMIEHGTAALCSLALGVSEVAVDLTAEYTKSREQFGQSIATFQAVGQRAADAYVDAEGIRLTSWQAAWRLAEGLDASHEVAVAKIWAAEAGFRIVHAATHLHGGMGVDRDYPLHRHFLYAKNLELQLGGSTAHLRRLGAMIASSA